MLKSELCDKLRERIKASELWADRSRETATALSGLKCPECGRPEAWAYRDFPATIMCNHKSTCGARVKALELFPDILVNIERDFAPTKTDPHRPAREYLYARGLTSKSLNGLRFEYRKDIRKCGSGGVLFLVGKNSAGAEVWNGRIFSPPKGTDKSHNSGGTAGMVWHHPVIMYDPAKPTYVVEGIIDALSLIEMGLQAVAVLSSGQDPLKLELGELGKNLIIAFDGDEAGASGLKKWKTAYPAVKAIVPLKGDWNDLLRAHAPGKAAEVFRDQFPEMECRASLLLAKSVRDYADIWAMYYGAPPGLFTFKKKYWFAQVARGKGSKEAETPALDVQNISDFTCETDHFQLDVSSPDNPVYRYCLNILPANGQPTSCSLSGTELTNPWSIRCALLNYARVTWEGEIGASKMLRSKIVDAPAPVVRQVHLLGHDRESGCSVFQHFLVDRAGKVHLPDSKGFFRVSRKECLRPPSVPCVLYRKGEKLSNIYNLIDAAWPNNGALAVAWVVASWFVYVVKPELGFFPFLSLHGDTQTGKTHLVRKLNAMQCLDEEGLPMTKLNTGKGEIRKLAQRSGLFKALLEGNKQDSLRFDLESLLTLYNYGNSLQVRAVKSNDISTKETEFLSSLIFVQNKEPFRSKAQMERVISSWPFRSDDITDETTAAFRELQKIPLRDLGHCYVETMRHRKEIEAGWYDEYIRSRNEILSTVPDNRIAENHGLVLGFHRIAEKIFGVKNNIRPSMITLADRKHGQCNHRQATLADHFFEACDEISPETAAKFIEIDEEAGRMYIKLALALRSLDGVGFKFYAQQLHQDLKVHPAFLDSRRSYRGYWGELNSTVASVWIFDTAKIVG